MSFLGSRMFTPRLMVAAIFVGVVIGLVPSPARAQVADAVIEVLAQDQSQAVLPGVTVTVLRPDTGYTQTSVTDSTGVVRFIALQPGTYNVKAELSGFTTVNQEGVTLRVGQTAKLTIATRNRQGWRNRERRRRGAVGGRVQDRLFDEHRARAD